MDVKEQHCTVSGSSLSVKGISIDFCCRSEYFQVGFPITEWGIEMIVGLLGSSCSGKSFFLKLLRDAGFYVPMSVTTRPQREEEMWHLRNVEKREFEKLNAGGSLCFVTEAFGNLYACMEFSEGAVDGDVAIIITKGNIPELRKGGGRVVRILPSDPQMAMEKIQLLKRGDMERRRTELLADIAESDGGLVDRVFYNGYDAESCWRFLVLMDELRQKK